ncbi:MAG: hypothetical protein ABIK79_03150, partial [Chloroflexota bacterium]
MEHFKGQGQMNGVVVLSCIVDENVLVSVSITRDQVIAVGLECHKSPICGDRGLIAHTIGLRC